MTLIIKKLNYKSKKIFVIDNFFNFHQQTYFENFCLHSFYSPRSYSSDITIELYNHYLHCRLKKEEDKRFGLINEKLFAFLHTLFPKFNGINLEDSWINLTLPYGQYQTHVDSYFKENGNNTSMEVTLLYHATSNWNDTYNGQTLFFNYNDLCEAELAVSYKTGRMIIFDSTIPHKPALSCNHKKPRYVYVAKILLKRES